MNQSIPDCPRCASDDTFVFVDTGQFGCFACGHSRGPLDAFLELDEDPEVDAA